MPSIFTYDAPLEASIFPTNGPPAGLGAITVVGQNFGTTFDVTRDILVGNTGCSSVEWQSDSSIRCLGLRRGTGAFKNIRVNIGGKFDGISTSGRTNENINGLVWAFSYDRPTISAVSPANGPPRGYVTDMTIYGQNFGFGPEFVSFFTLWSSIRGSLFALWSAIGESLYSWSGIGESLYSLVWNS